ncbi:MAG: DUF1565 domain-containing protein [Propionibacteriaceae bacterium]|nr:DUF1565 domain-containing protein [Propionibacteriaceae bacterium]
MRRLRTTALCALPLLLLGLNMPTAAAAPENSTTIHVSAASGDDSNAGSAQAPLRTLGAALEAAGDGDTIELADGDYREGELVVRKQVTIVSADGAGKATLNGADVVTDWTASGDGTWSTPHDKVRFCDVCTTDPDPARLGAAAHPEQVFIDGVEQTQVLSRDELKPGTFFVDDPQPVTLKQEGNSWGGFNAAPHRGVSYVLGSDPTGHTVEITQHSRALTLSGDGIVVDGLDVTKYSPVQRWDYADPEIGTSTGAEMVMMHGTDNTYRNATFSHSGMGTALDLSDATRATVSGNTFARNAAGGLGINTSHGVTITNNSWYDNNRGEMSLADCGAYCTIGDLKATHSENVTFSFNTFDYAGAPDRSQPGSTGGQPALWLDEGMINSTIAANYFVNTKKAIIAEVSSATTIASNIVNGAGSAIVIAGSDHTQVWNNTISHARTSIDAYEDGRTSGCNKRAGDGSCLQEESWSIEHGLSWDTTDTTLYNNIFSSETLSGPDDPWHYSPTVQFVGHADDNQGNPVWANQMVAGIDHNVYYRDKSSDVPNTTVLWTGPDKNVNAENLSDFTASPLVTTLGKEAHGLDLHGTAAENPLFIHESEQVTAWASSDLRLSEDSPARGSGTDLPAAVADLLGVSAQSPDRGALVNAAWQGDQPGTSAKDQSAAPAAEQASPDDDAVPDERGSADRAETPAAEQDTQPTTATDAGEAQHSNATPPDPHDLANPATAAPSTDQGPSQVPGNNPSASSSQNPTSSAAPQAQQPHRRALDLAAWASALTPFGGMALLVYFLVKRL